MKMRELERKGQKGERKSSEKIKVNLDIEQVKRK
jgi:hypothetical protein